DPAMGARPLRRSIQRLIEDPLADFVLGRDLKEGSTIVVDRRADPGPEDSLVDISIVEGAAPPEPEKVTVPADEPEEPDETDDVPWGQPSGSAPIVSGGAWPRRSPRIGHGCHSSTVSCSSRTAVSRRP